MSRASEFPEEAMYYFDSASRGVPPKRVLNSRPKQFAVDYHNGIFRDARDQAISVLKVKEKLAQFINGKAENIAFVPNREIAWNMIIQMLSEKYQHATISWSEDSTIFTPAKERLTLTIINDLSFSGKNSLFIGSSIDPLSGYSRLEELLHFDCPKVLDASYDLSTKTIEDYNAEILIAELSVDCLAPFPMTMIYFNDLSVFENNPFPSIGNIANFDESQYFFRSDVSKFEVGVPDPNILKYAELSLDYLNEIGKEEILHHKITIGEQILNVISKYPEFKILNTPFGSSGKPVSHFSIASKFSSHDIAILLDEIGGIKVRSGRICTHLAMKQLDIEGVVRLGWHLHIDNNAISHLDETLEQVLQMIS